MFNKVSTPFKITFTYVIFGILWILISDTVINVVFSDIYDIQSIQIYKGWLFIFISGLILYFLSKKLFNDLNYANNEVNESKALLENIINNAPVRIFWKNKDGEFLGANKSFLEDINLATLEELIGKKESDFNIKEFEKYFEDDSYIIENNRKKLNYIQTFTLENNERKILKTSKVPLLNKQNKAIGIIGVYLDITQEVEIENKIKKQESIILMQSKFSSMGEMIANIVHQWRQPLSIISTSATGIKLQKELGLSNDSFENEALDSINNNAQYLSSTIEDFRNFFQEDKLKNSVQLDEILNKALSLVNSRLKNKNIKTLIQCEQIEFETLSSELIHVFINIINNAVDAFETVTHEKFISIAAWQKNDIISINIKDNAGGISPKIIPRLFEPYFTTKESSKGTGIGLYMCKEIVVKHLYGKIDVKNAVFEYEGKNYNGAEFTIEILN